MLTFTMSEAQAVNIHNMASSKCSELKNHIISYVEKGKLDDAQRLIVQLREHQAIFAAFNREASHMIAASTGKPVQTERHVDNSSR